MIDKNNINVEDINLFYKNLLNLAQNIQKLKIYTKLLISLNFIKNVSEEKLIETRLIEKLELCKSIAGEVVLQNPI